MRVRPTVVVLALALAESVPGLVAQSACPQTFQGLGGLAAGASLTCRCDAEQTSVGSVWGSGRYTADSTICRAAVHAGAIPAAGGAVTLHAGGRCERFTGTNRNGIATSDWGGYDRTFAFREGVLCAGESPSARPPCPARGVDVESRAGACGLECSCSAEATGSVWGSDRYTADSSICAAARHAGAVRSSGGSIAVFLGGRCEAFQGSARNGIQSSDWGAYDATFGFRYPLPACSPPPSR
jgi:hypothetical protein